MKTFINMLRDEAGASAAEYALILAIVGATDRGRAVTWRIDQQAMTRAATASTRFDCDVDHLRINRSEYRGRPTRWRPPVSVSVANSPQQLTRVLNKRLRKTGI